MNSLFNTIIIIGTYRFVLCYDSSSEEVTLTTAKERSSGSPKPSTLYRRINVDRVGEISSTPLDLFRIRAPARRRSHMDTVWKWDFWCQLQPKIGNCTKDSRRHFASNDPLSQRGMHWHYLPYWKRPVSRKTMLKVPYSSNSSDVHLKIFRRTQRAGPRQSYYYDAQLDSCLTFSYSGCNGNRNNFQDLVDCERHCKGAAYMSLKESSRTTYCGLQPNAGLCMALIQRFYYDVNGEECKPFTYGGCGGNQNRFKTIRMCNQRCKIEADDKEY